MCFVSHGRFPFIFWSHYCYLDQLKDKMLEDENKLLAFKLHQQDIALSGSMRDLELGYHPDRDFAAQMPITFRVQPSHPNLQENN